MDAQDAAILLQKEKCVLFLGSGISMPKPSSLPSAIGIVRSFLGQLAIGIVEDAVLKSLLERWPLPEYVYGTVERFFGSQVFDVWSALDLWRGHAGDFSPNAGHLAAVAISARNNTPLLTPNFDTYFEDAAMRLGIPCIVSVAVPGRHFVPKPVRTGEVAIWKLHGTVTDLSTVFSNVRTLTAPIKGLIEAIQDVLNPDIRLVFGGYSGRDLDLFPLVANRQNSIEPVWIDLEFANNHRSNFTTPPARQIQASFDEVGRAYATLTGGALQESVVSSAARATNLFSSSAAALLDDEMHEHVIAVADRFFDVNCRKLVFAELLINAGLLHEAESLLSPVSMSGLLETERIRLQAKVLWELRRFRTAFEQLKVSYKRPDLSSAERDILRFAIRVAELRMRVAPRGLKGVSRVSKWWIASTSVISVGRLLVGWKRIRLPSLIPEPIRTPFVEGYLEHFIRILLSMQFIVTRANGQVSRFFRSLLVPAWRVAYRKSISRGYAEGIGNAGRYLSRLYSPEPNGIRAAHEFLGHTLGLAIAYRDAATRAQYVGNHSLAAEFFALGYKLALDQGDPVLLVTFNILGEELGIPIEVTHDVFASIESPWAEEHLQWRLNHDT